MLSRIILSTNLLKKTDSLTPTSTLSPLGLGFCDVNDEFMVLK